MLMRVYRERKLNRLRNWDYTSPGWYFVTICTKNKFDCLGEIINGEMVLNKCGRIVSKQWLWLKQRYRHVVLDEFVIMPNHFHGILVIKTDDFCGRDRSSPYPQIAIIVEFNRCVQNHIVENYS